MIKHDEDTQPSPNHQDSIKRLTALIEFEIERLHSQASQPGWTIWALLGALATIIWFLLSELGKNDLDLFVLSYLLLFIYLTIHFLWFIYQLFDYSPKPKSRISRFLIAEHDYGPFRRFYFFYILLSFILFSLLIRLRSLFPPFALFIFSTYLMSVRTSCS